MSARRNLALRAALAASVLALMREGAGGPQLTLSTRAAASFNYHVTCGGDQIAAGAIAGPVWAPSERKAILVTSEKGRFLGVVNRDDGDRLVKEREGHSRNAESVT